MVKILEKFLPQTASPAAVSHDAATQGDVWWSTAAYGPPQHPPAKMNLGKASVSCLIPQLPQRLPSSCWMVLSETLKSISSFQNTQAYPNEIPAHCLEKPFLAEPWDKWEDVYIMLLDLEGLPGQNNLAFVTKQKSLVCMTQNKTLIAAISRAIGSSSFCLRHITQLRSWSGFILHRLLACSHHHLITIFHPHHAKWQRVCFYLATCTY